MGESSGGAEEDAARAAGLTMTRSDAEEASATELGVILSRERQSEERVRRAAAEEEARADERRRILSGRRAQVCAGRRSTRCRAAARSF